MLTSMAFAGPGGPDEVAANVLLGKTHEQVGQLSEAQRAFEAALVALPQSCPPEVYLKLGNMHLQQGHYQYAADVYLQACNSHPCASAWLGLGTAYVRLGRLADADMVLSEANTCDGRNNLVWGYLALVHVLVENHAEAAEVSATYYSWFSVNVFACRQLCLHVLWLSKWIRSIC